MPNPERASAIDAIEHLLMIMKTNSVSAADSGDVESLVADATNLICDGPSTQYAKDLYETALANEGPHGRNE